MSQPTWSGARGADIPAAAQISLHGRTRVRGKHFYLKIFGERNTGSNYLEQLCGANFVVSCLRGGSGALWPLGNRLAGTLPPADRIAFQQAVHDIDMQRILRSDFGWKHAAPPVDLILDQPHAIQTVFLILTKHPYSWAQSLHRRPYSHSRVPPAFSEFIRSRFPVSFSDCLGPIGPVNPIVMFRLKVVKYLELLRSGLCVRHIRYEDLLGDGAGQMEALQPYLQRRGPEFVDIERDVKGSARSRADFAREYALDDVGKSLDPADRQFIAEQLGADVFKLLGYQP